MKRILILVVLVVLAGIAGIVARSASSQSGVEGACLAQSRPGRGARGDSPKYELAPGAQVELAGLNGSVTIETSDTKTAEVHIERMAASDEA